MKFTIALICVYAIEINAFLQTNVLSNIIKGADVLFKQSTDYVGFDPVLHEDALLDVVSILNDKHISTNISLYIQASYNNKVWISF